MDKYNINKEDFEYDSDLGEYEAEKIRDIKIDELNQDPTIAIIDYRITSEEELNRIYTKYSLLPRKFKRFSNYYSTQLLGYNVPNMYSIMVDRLVDNDYIFGKEDEYELSESAEVLNEKFVGSEPDLYYNIDKFNNGEVKLCFIFGHSGSGKSTLGKSLADNKTDFIELDEFLCVKDRYTMNQLKDYSSLVYDFFNGPGKKYYIGIEERENIDKDDYENKIFIDFIDYAKKYVKSHKDKKFVIEGVYLFLFFEPEDFKDYSVVIKGTSFIKSKIRASKRELHGEKGSKKERIDIYGRNFRFYLLDENKINKFRKYYEDLPETEEKEPEKFVKENLDIFNEKFINSEPDLYYKQKEFDKGEVNLCFVIGYSGSGKTVLTRKYKNKYKDINVEKVELDDIVCIKDHFTMEELKDYSNLLYSFFSGPGKKYYVGVKERSDNPNHKDVFPSFIKYAMKYASSHKDTKFILEGIWTYLFFDNPAFFDKYAVYMKGTSKMKSKMRRMKRELKEAKNKDLKSSWNKLKEFGIYFTDTTLHDGRIDKFRKYFESKPETVLKTESGKKIVKEYFDMIDEYVVKDNDLGELYESIMNDDELTIQEKAELESELYLASKDILFEETSSKLVPWFTMDEGYTSEDMFEDPNYAKKLLEATNKYKYIQSDENKENVLKLGWNPSLPVNETTVKQANARQNNWFRQRGKSVQDIVTENSYICYNFEDFKMVPYYTVSEGCKLENFEDDDYSFNVITAMNEYVSNPSEDNKNKVIDLGWNPEIQVNQESIQLAKNRQIDWLKSHLCTIQDVSKVEVPLIESSSMMRSLYIQKDLYPVYIVLSWTNTAFGKLIRFVKNSTYTHAGITLDSDLTNILTFKYGAGYNGFCMENLAQYIKTYEDCQIEVLCLFVDKDRIKELKNSIKYYEQNSQGTRYGFKNLFNVVFNKKKTFTEYDTEMICSQFVDHILKLSDINITKKANNLVIPQDYVTVAVENPKVYKLYEGFGKQYSDRRTESIIKNLIDTDPNIRYIEEGAFNQVIMGFKIHPHQNLEQTLKAHKYPGYLNLINKTNNKDDLYYIRNDINQGIRTIEKIKEKIISKDQSNKYVKLGISEKDCDETIKWFDTVAKKAISDKIKSLK